MDNTPIDINYAKLLDWVIKRRICKQNWMDQALVVREKINHAIQDMPAHEEIQKLLTGTYINYFHCVRIVDILRETEADTRNIFGRYSSQRMKDWQAIVKDYEVDSTYIAESAQMMYRNVNYEIPALRRQLTKCNKSKQDCLRKEADYKTTAQDLHNKFSDTCKSYHIQGTDVKQELLSLSSDVISSLDKIGAQCAELQDALTFYDDFMCFRDSSYKRRSRCKTLDVLAKKGNITCYELRTGSPPPESAKVATQPASVTAGHVAESSNAAGDIDWDTIDFGDVDSPSADDTIDFDIELDTGIEVADSGNQDLMATTDAASFISDTADGQSESKSDAISSMDLLTVLENPTTRFLVLDDMEELLVFLDQSFLEAHSSSGTDVITMTITQSMGSSIQLSEKCLQGMTDKCRDIVSELSSSRLQQLLSIKNSPRFLERLTEKIESVKHEASKMEASARLMTIRYGEADEEISEIYPKIDLIKAKTTELKQQVEKAVSKKCKDRQVNIMGEINSI